VTPALGAGPVSDDPLLLARVAAGDHAAMERLYDRYSPMVMALALRILRERAPAEELLNDVFMELWSRVERFDAARGNLLTYLLTLCRSRAIDRLRAQRRHAAVGLDEAGTAAPDADGRGAPSLRLEDEEHRQRVAAALAQLGADQRKALELAYFEDLSHSQIAALLGRPLGTVKTHVRQGLIQMRELLRTMMGDPRDERIPGRRP
jgi:RNA polymerase sigma-70 factor (ECF subfamily)